MLHLTNGWAMYCVQATAERPRLSVFRSNKHIYAQVIDDVSGTTLVSASSQSETIRTQLDGKKKTDVAELVGQAVAAACKEKEIGTVVSTEMDSSIMVE